MGIADREYQRHTPRPGGGLFAQLTPVVKWLLILNLGIYFLDTFLKGNAPNGPMRQFGAFAIESAIFQGAIWEFVTFQFLHGSLGHVFFNCVGIFFFGPWLERWWGSQKFLWYYLLCGVGGALFFTLLAVTGVVANGYLVGASAGIYGIFIGVAVVAPDLRVALFFPPIELSMRQLALALLAIALGTILFEFGNEGGEAGHLGGAIVGFLLMRYPRLLGRNGRIEILPPKTYSGPPPAAKLRPRSQLEIDRASAVDVILDKISRDGFQSLTPEEREFLQKASESNQSK